MVRSKKKVFVSFVQTDDSKRRALCRILEGGHPSFDPIVVSARRAPGRSLTEKVSDGIKEADYFVAILTRTSLTNQWVNQEIGFAVALEKKHFVIVDQSMRNDLKGFVHGQQDLPFSFSTSGNSRREAAAFRKAAGLLQAHLAETTGIQKFQSQLIPEIVKRGESYTTVVDFQGRVSNGFFDNRVIHQDSDFRKWNADPETLVVRPGRKANVTPGTLNGQVQIHREYSYSTVNWPVGRYKVYVRLYSHLIPGQRGRQVVTENEHDLVVT